MNRKTITRIAQVAHEINRAYCQSIGDDSQPEWDHAPEWQRNSALAGVDMHLANPDATPEESHAAWLETKLAEGWTYGPEKDVQARQHPCCVPYEALPPEQKSKDYLFRAVVHALKDQPEPVRRAAVALAPDGLVAVRYIAAREFWEDTLYNTGLTFTPGMVRNLPLHVARDFLRHGDVFERVEPSEAPPQQDDDTAALLEESASKRVKRDERTVEFNLIDQVRTMTDRDSLVEFAMTRCGLKLTRNMRPDTMQERIIDHINRFGAQ